MKRNIFFIVSVIFSSIVATASTGLNILAENYLQSEEPSTLETEEGRPNGVLQMQESLSDLQLLKKVQIELKDFAIRLNSFITEKKFDVVAFEPVIFKFTLELMVLNTTLAVVEEPKLYPELLLRMFSRQYKTMMNASQKYKRFKKTGLLGDRMVYEMVEFKVISMFLDSTFFVLLRDTVEFEATILRHNCRFRAAVDEYRELLNSTKIHHESIFWVSVARTRKSIDSLKRLLGGRRTWGQCPNKKPHNLTVTSSFHS